MCSASTRAPVKASVLLNSKKGELPVCNAAYKGDLHELKALAHQGPGRKLNVGEKGHPCILWHHIFPPLHKTPHIHAWESSNACTYWHYERSLSLSVSLSLSLCLCLSRSTLLVSISLFLSLSLSLSDADDNTPLHWAAVRGHPKATEYLIKCDADVNFKNKGELSRPSCHHISVIIKWCKYIICNKNLCLLVPSHIRMSVCARAVCRHPNNAGLLNNMYILSYW
jgi:ankyrin repeat protein